MGKGRPDRMGNLVLITGGCGFIGANLVEYLLERGGYRVRILDNFSTGRREYLERIRATLERLHRHSEEEAVLEVVTGDVRDRERVEQAVRGVAAVVHLAAHTSVVDSLRNPEEDFQINVVGTFNLLEACRHHGIERFIYASSNAAVGEQEPPIDETKVPAPLSPYGASKLAGEALCSAYYHSFGIKAVALRFANVYGPYSEHKTSVVARFIQRAKQRQPLVIYGDGTQTRDFIHARDIAQAIELALHYEPQGIDNLVFQIGSGQATTIRELAELVRDLARASGLEPPTVKFESPRPGEIIRNFSDIRRAREHLGYRPQIELKNGLSDTWRYFVHR